MPSVKTGASLARGRSIQDVETPPDLINAVTSRFGPLAFDLAATEHNTKAERFYCPEHDSLVQNWNINGTLWLNPPYDRIDRWVDRCCRFRSRILVLVPASIGSNWFRDFVHNRAAVIALNGRPTFVGQTTPYPKDLMLLAYRIRPIGFDVWKWRL